MTSADEVSAAPPAVPADLARESVCYLETTGRISGRPHEIEIWFAAEGPMIYMLSGGGYGADWVKNLQKTPRLRVRIGGRVFAGSARVIAGEPGELHARRLVAAKYYGWREGALPNRAGRGRRCRWRFAWTKQAQRHTRVNPDGMSAGSRQRQTGDGPMEAMRDDAGYVLRRDEGKRLTFPRSQITYKVTGQQSGGLLTINEASYAGPAEIALHTHPGVPEAFFALEGSFTFYIADQRIEAAPGDLVFAPAGLPHGYRVGPQGGRLLTVWAPADLEGFFEELHRSRANGGLTADERRDLAAKYGMHLLGPLPDD